MFYNIAKAFAGLFVILLLFSFESCSRNNEGQGELSSDTKGFTKIPDNNISESDADLFNVNYREFYDELSQHGKWIEVNAKDIGIEGPKGKGTAAGEIEDKQEFLSHVFGIKDANAETVADVDWGVFFVWSPDPGLAVAVNAGEPAYYVPYANGQWYYTDAGWYFAGATYYEDITFHYGRWVLAPGVGWIWVPGRVWAPAWVEWYDDDDYIAWGPIPPRYYFVDNVIVYPWYVDDNRFICVEKTHFLDPGVYRYRYFYNVHENGVRIKDMRRVDGLYAENNTIFNRGPEVKDIQNHWGKNIDKMSIERVHDKSAASISGNQMKVYSPQFSRYKNAGNMNSPVSRPKSYVSMNNVVSESRSNNKMDNADKNGNQNSSGQDKGNIKGNQKSQNNQNKSWNNGNKNDRSVGSDKNSSRNNKSWKNDNGKNDYNGSQNKDSNRNKSGDKSWNKGNNNNSNSPKGKDNNTSGRRGSYKQQSSGSHNQGDYKQSNGNQRQSSGSHGDRSNNGSQRNGKR